MDALSRQLYYTGRRLKMARKLIRERLRQKLEERGYNVDYFRMREALEEDEERIERMIRKRREKKKIRWV